VEGEENKNERTKTSCFIMKVVGRCSERLIQLEKCEGIFKIMFFAQKNDQEIQFLT
jgi:hypothetical protein